jgi:hypothetical protein
VHERQLRWVGPWHWKGWQSVWQGLGVRMGGVGWGAGGGGEPPSARVKGDRKKKVTKLLSIMSWSFLIQMIMTVFSRSLNTEQWYLLPYRKEYWE